MLQWVRQQAEREKKLQQEIIGFKATTDALRAAKDKETENVRQLQQQLRKKSDAAETATIKRQKADMAITCWDCRIIGAWRDNQCINKGCSRNANMNAELRCQQTNRSAKDHKEEDHNMIRHAEGAAAPSAEDGQIIDGDWRTTVGEPGWEQKSSAFHRKRKSEDA